MSTTRCILMTVAVAFGLGASAMDATARGVRMHNRDSGSTTSSADAVDQTVERPQFTIDRRPVAMLRFWNATYDEDPMGIAERFRGTDFGPVLEEELELYYQEGWRRIMLLLPTGAPSHLVLDRTLEEWTYRSSQWKEEFRTAIRRFLARRPEVRLGVYQGFRLRSASYPSEAQLSEYLQPWLDMGFKEFGIDFSGANISRDTFVMAHRWLAARGAKAIMEAYPRVKSGDLDWEYMKQISTMAAPAFHEKVDPSGSWAFNPRLTEVYIQVGRAAEEVEPQHLERLRARGLILMAFSNDSERRKAVLEASGFTTTNSAEKMQDKRANRRTLRYVPPRRVRY